MFISILLGLIPEFLYYYLYLTRIKELKKHIIIFGILTFINYFVSMLLTRHSFIMYVIFDTVEYLILKLLYKDKTCITDFFLLLFIEIYMLIISAICYYLIPNYILAFIVNRVLLFVPLIFIKKIKLIYKKYRNMWNRNDNKLNSIKSLTLRNASLLLMNILIVATYLILMYILS